jgi:hypothetical protein
MSDELKQEIAVPQTISHYFTYIAFGFLMSYMLSINVVRPIELEIWQWFVIPLGIVGMLLIDKDVRYVKDIEKGWWNEFVDILKGKQHAGKFELPQMVGKLAILGLIYLLLFYFEA